MFLDLASKDKDINKLNKVLRKYALNMFEKMIIFFDESLENIQINSFLQNFNEHYQQKLYDSEQIMKKEYEFIKKCYYCIDFDSYNYISGTSATLNEKLNSKYCSSTNVFIYETKLKNSLVEQREEIENNDPFVIDYNFINKFEDLRLLNIFNNRIEFDNLEKHSTNKLIEISFYNNNLTKIPNFVFESKNLLGLKISNNLVKSLDQNINNFVNLSNLQNLLLSDISLGQSDYNELYGNKLIQLPNTLKSLILHSIPFDFIPFNIENLQLEELAFTGIKILDLVR